MHLYHGIWSSGRTLGVSARVQQARALGGRTLTLALGADAQSQEPVRTLILEAFSEHEAQAAVAS